VTDGSNLKVEMKKKLIEVALPLEAINVSAADEKAVPRRGHPQTIHLWWARRPLAACRAMLFASLIDDPSSRPDLFPDSHTQEKERQRLFRVIEDLVKWENSNNHRVLEQAQSEISKYCGNSLPTVLDPFAGGGSIPLEAERLGLRALANDLNPVAVLITKSLIEVPRRFVGHLPINPRIRAAKFGGQWPGVSGLADDVRYYGRFVLEEASRRLQNNYPTGPKGERILAYQWARTIKCPNPACSSTLPLTTTFQLSVSKGTPAWIVPEPDPVAKKVRFTVALGTNANGPEGTIQRSGARCLLCSTLVPFSHIRNEGQAKRLGLQLMAMVAEGPKGRTYLSPSEEQEAGALVPPPPDAPDEQLPEEALGFRVQAYGIKSYRELFTDRQLAALCTFSNIVQELRKKVVADAVEEFGQADNRSLADGGAGAFAYADALALYLTFCISRLASYCNTICHWNLKGGSVSQIFTRNAIPMSWDFMEICPIADFSGSWPGAVEWVADVLANLVPGAEGKAYQLDSSSALPTTQKVLISTDPPYYDNIGYADLSDFFYVWLRRTLQGVFPALFSTLLVPKTQELVANPHRFHGNREAAQAHFENGLMEAFSRMRAVQHPDFPMTVYYAFKQSESHEEDHGDGAVVQVASTGWETMLHGLHTAGFSITGTWPIRSEKRGRMRSFGSNALASSIVLVCRPRPESAPITTRKDFLYALKKDLPRAVRDLQTGNIAPVDLAQAAIGPGMAVFSRYQKVLESDGSPMRVRTALGLINQALDEVFSEQEGEFDPDTRWALAWFEQHSFDEGPYGDAEVLATAKALSVSGLDETKIIRSRAGKVRLLRRDELSADWNPSTEHRLTVWTVTQHLIRSLDKNGEAATATLTSKVGGLAETARDLAYRLYVLSERKGWAEEAGYYNSLVVSWPAIAPKAFALS
jgi:putative DNA methylase